MNTSGHSLPAVDPEPSASGAGGLSEPASKPTTQPLAGIKIIELAAIGPVPFAGRILRQMGAAVTVVAAPLRQALGIPMAADPLDAGKARIALDLKSAEGAAALHALLADSAVLIEGFRPGTLERLGLAPAALHARYPRLVVGRCGGWGADIARAAQAGHDINYLALAGVLGAIGPAEAPVPPLNLIGDFGGAAMHLALGVVAALLRVVREGRGGVVETSIYEATVALTAHLHGLRDAGLWQDQRQANLLDGGAPFYACYATADGQWLALGALEPKFFAELVARIGARVDVAQQYERGTWPAMRAEFARAIALRSRDEWDALLAGTDACATPVLSWAEARARPAATALLDGDAAAVRFSGGE